MSEENTFRELAEVALQRNPQLAGMEVIVEKELLLYELLNVLQRGRWLDGLTFQGGTALRLCYGSSRLSEDMEFSGGPDFSATTMDRLAAYLEQALSDRGLGVEVRPPKNLASRRPSGGGVSTWRISFEVRPRQRDVPRQMVKLDIDNAPVHTEGPGAIAQNYGVTRTSEMLVRVQSREEILASKLVAFPDSVANQDRPRYRDVWDMNWLTRTGTAVREDLLRFKLDDRRLDRPWLETAAMKAGDIVRSSEFASEMRRFLLPHVAEDTLDNPMYMEFLATETARLMRLADSCLDEQSHNNSGRSQSGRRSPSTAGEVSPRTSTLSD